MTRPEPWFLSTLRTSPRGSIGGAFFGLCFLGGGLFFLFMAVLKPSYLAWRAGSWVETPATVLSSELKTSRGSKGGTTYRVSVQYRYRYDGSEFTGDRYSFATGTSNIGVGQMQAAVARLRPGSSTTVWVNPSAPAEAIVERGLPHGMLVWALFCTPFIFVGTAISGMSIFGPAIAQRIRTRRTAELVSLTDRGDLRWPTALPPDVWEQKDLAVLISQDRRLGVAIVITGIAIFWNSLISVFVVALFSDAQRIRTSNLWPQLFLVPFILIGLVLIFKCVRAWQETRRPKWTALISPLPGHEGGEVTVALGFHHDSLRPIPPVARLELVAVTTPIAPKTGEPAIATSRSTIRRRHTAKPDKSEYELARVSVPLDPARGYAKVTLPPVEIPADRTDQHTLVWWLEVEDDMGEFESAVVSQEDRWQKQGWSFVPPPRPSPATLNA